jgi:hypothetical protein
MRFFLMPPPIMSLPHPDSVESIRAILTCASEEFKGFYNNERLDTGVIVREALDDIIGPNRVRLRDADNRYRFHDLLSAMLVHAPHPLGQRYVAVCLHIAHKKGEDGIVNAAKVWLDNIFLPSARFFFFLRLLHLMHDGSVLAISKIRQTEPSSSQTPTVDLNLDQHTVRAKASVMLSSSRFWMLIDLRLLSESSFVVR